MFPASSVDYQQPFVALFYLAAPLLLALRFFHSKVRKAKRFWIWGPLLLIVFGWVMAAWAVEAYYLDLEAKLRIETDPQASEVLAQKIATDTVRVFMPILGWVTSTIYVALCAGFYGLANLFLDDKRACGFQRVS